MAKKSNTRQSTQHTHKPRRQEYKSGYVEYYCTLPGCTYRARDSFWLGKLAICWKCSREFSLTVYDISRKEPRCFNCKERKHTFVSTLSLDEVTEITATANDRETIQAEKKIDTPTKEDLDFESQFNRILYGSTKIKVDGEEEEDEEDKI